MVAPSVVTTELGPTPAEHTGSPHGLTLPQQDQELCQRSGTPTQAPERDSALPVAPPPPVPPLPPPAVHLPCPWPAVGLSLPIAILKGEDSGSGTDRLPGALWWQRQRLRAEAPNSAEWPPRAGAAFSEANRRMRF